MNFKTIVKRKLKYFLLIFKNFFYRNYFILYKGKKKYDVIVFDDIFPHPISGFRFEEFKFLLTNFRMSKVVVHPTAYEILNTPVKNHQKHIREFESQFNLKKRIELRKGFVNINAKIFYCIFLHNIFKNLHWLEKHKIPFIFTLYPGGGFKLEEAESDTKLKKVCQSPMFRKVIVTQQITYDYLLKNNICSEEKIKFIFGCVVPQISMIKDLRNKKSYLLNKATFDICFCAAKYTPTGEDKGYDVFIDFAKGITQKYSFINFHIVGGFNENDIDVSDIKEKIKFYGYQNFEALGVIYQNMDVLVSPNKAFKLGKGGFDGFPLGTVVEATLNGVVALTTDEFKQNSIFTPEEDLIIIDSSAESIMKHIIELIENPEKLYCISRKGMQKFREVYSNKIQMEPRINLIKNEIAE
ncbi:glycosyltransferase [Flavobacterium phragmitis]|uniref:Glycosyltransferase involved in cell wall bisynthesis n=1 Tax=Flavobacterium phragmitis TaxID=739143 RepID=A0A1I1UTA0_9FLAO|nr:glycosyltransferase [Flavobacterium phragmitis]SFD72898.1 Glycosyltransferase involved in cell wall bisynthesis [Flavobacterium phragmitis]